MKPFHLYIYAYCDRLLNFFRKNLDFMLSDHFKIKSEFALVCIVKIIFSCILISLIKIDSHFINFLIFIFFLSFFIMFTFAFRNAILLFSTMNVVFISTLNLIDDSQNISSLLKIEVANFDIFSKTILLLICFIIVIFFNLFKETAKIELSNNPQNGYKKQEVLCFFLAC